MALSLPVDVLFDYMFVTMRVLRVLCPGAKKREERGERGKAGARGVLLLPPTSLFGA